MRLYSLDLRLRVVDSLESNKRRAEVAKLFKVGIATVRRWIALSNSGSLAAKNPINIKPRKVDYERAKEIIEQNPDKTLKELGELIGTKDMGRVMKKLNITYKKTLLVRGENGRFTRRIPKNPDKH